MPNPYFRFKQFTVYHDRCAMKVGTDGVLLGAWAQVDNCKTILDIGTGTGLIALMLAQRSKANILGIEIDRDAYLQAKENIGQSPWNERIKIVHASLQEFAEIPQYSFDGVVSNPPFFINSLKAKGEARAKARHNHSLPLPDLFEATNKLMKPTGSFSVILPAEQKKIFCQTAKDFRLNPSRIMYVKPTPEKAPKRVMLEFSKKQTNVQQEELVIESDGRHGYSEEYKRLTGDFYL